MNDFIFRFMYLVRFVFCSLETGSRRNVNGDGARINEPTGPQPHPSGYLLHSLF